MRRRRSAATLLARVCAAAARSRRSFHGLGSTGGVCIGEPRRMGDGRALSDGTDHRPGEMASPPAQIRPGRVRTGSTTRPKKVLRAGLEGRAKSWWRDFGRLKDGMPRTEPRANIRTHAGPTPTTARDPQRWTAGSHGIVPTAGLHPQELRSIAAPQDLLVGPRGSCDALQPRRSTSRPGWSPLRHADAAPGPMVVARSLSPAQGLLDKGGGKRGRRRDKRAH